MSEDTAKGPGEITPENLSERIKTIAQRDTATAVQPAVEANAAPAAVAPSPAGAADANITTTPEPDWWDSGLQVDHGMLKNRKGEEVVKMLTHAQRKIQELGTKARELESQRQVTQTPQPAPQAATATVPVGDPRRAEYAIAVFTDPERALEIQTEIALERWRAEEDAKRIKTEQQAFYDNSQNAGQSVIAKIVEESGLDKATVELRMGYAANEVGKLAMKAFDDYGGNTGEPDAVAAATKAYYDVWQSADSYTEAYNRLYGTPEAPAIVTAPSVAPRPDPPGAKNVAPAKAAAPRQVKRLDPDAERALQRLGDGIISKEGMERVALRLAARRA